MSERPGGISENEVEDVAFDAAKKTILVLVLLFAAATGAVCKKHSDDQVPARDAIEFCAKTTSGEVGSVL